MESANCTSSTSRLASLLGIIFFTVAPFAHGDFIASPYLSLTPAQFTSYNGYIGGTLECGTVATYDAGTYDLAQSGVCTETGLNIGGDLTGSGVYTEASLSATVDNFGQVVDGTFSLFGIIEVLGITDLTLLASGTLLDAEYGGTPNFMPLMMQSLIELDFVIAELGGMGDLLLWGSNAQSSAWFGGQEWQVDTDDSDWANFTGSQYFFYDRATIMPEPGTLALFAMGLVVIGLARHRRKT